MKNILTLIPIIFLFSCDFAPPEHEHEPHEHTHEHEHEPQTIHGCLDS